MSQIEGGSLMGGETGMLDLLDPETDAVLMPDAVGYQIWNGDQAGGYVLYFTENDGSFTSSGAAGGLSFTCPGGGLLELCADFSQTEEQSCAGAGCIMVSGLDADGNELSTVDDAAGYATERLCVESTGQAPMSSVDIVGDGLFTCGPYVRATVFK